MSSRVEITDPLGVLDAQLSISLGNASSRMSGWIDPTTFAKTLRSIKQAFDNPTVRTDKDFITEALTAFRCTKQVPTYTHLRYICLGAGLPIGDWYLISDDELWPIVCERAAQGELRKQIKCYQGLLWSYWSFAAQTAEPSGRAYQGWLRLRGWLHGCFDRIKRDLKADPNTRLPQWFSVLEEHRNLLTKDPCGRYGASLLSGDNSLLESAVNGLGIPTGSWVYDEAIVAQVRHSTEAQDSEFMQKLPLILNIVLASGGKQISKSLATRCIASLVSRYAKCATTPEHIPLRDVCLEFIGNPWLRRAAWDAHVLKPNGQPDDAPREMIHGWLRTRLIKDFFEILSEEKAADQRRLNYWLRYEASIVDMWFILGNTAFNSQDKEYVEFKSRARGRILQLGGQTSPTNNAFVMKIGDHVVIEFGEKGNACFVFAWDGIPTDVTKKLLSGVQRLEIDIHTLRFKTWQKRLIHMDSPSLRRSWEEKFDEELIPVLNAIQAGRPYSLRGSRSVESAPRPLRASPQKQTVLWVPPDKKVSSPSSRPLFSWSELELHITKHRLKVADNRRVGGAYWVLIDNTLPEITNPLRSWGFRYKPGKGWWRE